MATAPLTSQTVRDQIVADAKSLPDLIQKASVLDPAMAQALTGQAQTASKTPLGAIIAAGIAWLAAHYGLGWGQATDDLVAGAAVLAGGYLTHWWQTRNVKSLLATQLARGLPPTLLEGGEWRSLLIQGAPVVQCIA